MSENDERLNQATQWQVLNLLGFVLMRVRAQLAQESDML